MDLALVFLGLTVISVAPLLTWCICSWFKEYFSGSSKGTTPPWGQLPLGEDLLKEKTLMKDYDIKLLKTLYDRGEASFDEIAVFLKEASYSVADRLRRLEERGFIARTPTGSIIITEAGYKYIEALKEKLVYKRKDIEILEELVNK